MIDWHLWFWSAPVNCCVDRRLRRYDVEAPTLDEACAIVKRELVRRGESLCSMDQSSRSSLPAVPEIVAVRAERRAA